jgi:hypothetical protein
LNTATNTPAKASTNTGGAQTDLDREVERARRIGEEQKHVFGERGRGAPDFNKIPENKIPDNKVPDPGARPATAPPATPPVNQPRP